MEYYETQDERIIPDRLFEKYCVECNDYTEFKEKMVTIAISDSSFCGG